MLPASPGAVCRKVQRLTAPASVGRILNHLGLPSEAPRPQAVHPRASPLPQLELADGGTQPDDFYADPSSPQE
jgi:hypothetical protein